MTERLADDDTPVNWRQIAEETAGRLHFLIGFMDGQGWLDDHSFTFPDGETWHAVGVVSDTSSNVRPDTADDGTYWPASAPAAGSVEP